MADDEQGPGGAGWSGGGAAALAAHAPDVLASYEVLVSVRPLGVHDEMLESPAVTAFTAQFRADAQGIDEELRARFVQATGGHTQAVARMVWIADVAPRIRGTLDSLFGPTQTWPGRRRYPVADIGLVVERFLEAVEAFLRVELDDSSDRPDAANTALALLDAMARTPGDIPDSVVAAVHELLAPAEAVAVVLDGARRSAAKIETALVA